MEILATKQVQIVSYKLKGGASVWWEQLQNSRWREGKPPIKDWVQLREKMHKLFLPLDFEQILYQQYHYCHQRERSVQEYTEEFYRLNAHNDLPETEGQQVSRCISGLQDAIQNQMTIRSIWTISNAVSLAYRLENQSSKSSTRIPPPRRALFDPYLDKPN